MVLLGAVSVTIGFNPRNCRVCTAFPTGMSSRFGMLISPRECTIHGMMKASSAMITSIVKSAGEHYPRVRAASEGMEIKL